MINYTFGILPTIMRHDARVSDFACRLYSEVDSLSNKYGYCFATNTALAKNLQKSPSQISRTLSELEGLGYVSLVVEDGYKRKIYPKRDFRDMEGVDENAEGGTQNCVGGYAELRRGVRKNSMTANKIIELDKHNKIIEEPKIKNEIEVIPSKAKKTKDKAYKIFPPTLENVVPLMYDKLVEKKRVHTNIVDCWNNANMQAEKFILHHEGKGWKIERLNSAIALWVNNAISYGQVTKPCPIQYKGNPDVNKPTQPTKVHVEETVLTQSDIEAGSAHLAATKDVFAKMGVRV